MPAEQRIEQLLDVAEGLFGEQGYAATSIEDICRAAGVTRPVVYERLGNKEDAYLAVVNRVRHQLEEQLTEAALSAEEPREQLRRGIGAYFDYLDHQPRRWTILYGSSTPIMGELGRRLTEARFHTVDRIIALLRTHLPDQEETAVQAMGHLVSGALEQVGRWWIRNPDLTRDQMVDYSVDILWGGLSPFVPPDARG
jgi:AcrR family transcriptional regulator